MKEMTLKDFINNIIASTNNATSLDIPIYVNDMKIRDVYLALDLDEKGNTAKANILTT